jgi:tetratricopeptide (TPR) repeat protein
MLAMYEAQQGQHQEDDEWLGYYGDLLMSVGREEEACDLYATALALDPDDYEWVGNVAECNGEARPDMDHGMNDDAADESVMDYTTEPTYGEVSLEMGFEPDPHTMDVVAGGDTRVSIAGCYGYVLTSAPDVRLQYTTGESEESYPLSFYVSSQEDTVLFVNQPDGEWICNDDTQGTNPAITLDEPTEGQYDIWVGTYNAESNAMGNLMISEFDEIEWSVNLDK